MLTQVFDSFGYRFSGYTNFKIILPKVTHINRTSLEKLSCALASHHLPRT